MRRPAPRLTACLLTATATAALGVLLAPAAGADTDRPLPQQARDRSNAPSVVAHVPPFGRKIS